MSLVMLKIGELARMTGISVDAIRFYEKQNLIKSQGRTKGGYREFSRDTADLLHFVAKCRALDISLADIKKLLQVRSLSAKSCRDANAVIEDQLTKLRQRMAQLRKLEVQLSELKSVCNQELSPADCAIIRALNK